MYIKIISVLMVLFSLPSMAQVVSSELIEKKTMATVRLGVAVPQTETSQGNQDKAFVDLELSGRYAFSNVIGVTAGIGKWLGDSEVLTNGAGSLAYHVDAGLVLALTGSLIDKTKSQSKILHEKKEGSEKYNIVTRFQKKTVQNKFDGFRVGVHGSEYSFTKTAEAVYGYGGTIFYEHRVGSVYMKYGLKADILKNSRIDADLYQGFVGIGF